MKQFTREKKFKKNYKLRISTNPKLVKKFNDRLRLFSEGKRGHPINDHQLSGDKLGLRSFSITTDIRVIYRETTEEYIFLDI